MKSAVPVEVTVQDLTTASLDEEPAHPPNAIAPLASISPETWETWFQEWLDLLQPTDPDDGEPLHPDHSYELSLRLTQDAEIQALNAQYRQINQPTDVLAFAALEVDYPDLEASLPLYLGDIVISVETADKQAHEHGHPLTQELAWLAAHGLLHLLGWDHPDDASLYQMLHQQQQMLQKIGLSMPSHFAVFLDPPAVPPSV